MASFIFTLKVVLCTLLVVLCKGVVFAECLHALFKHGIEFVTHATGASAYAGLERTCGIKVDAGYTVGNEFLGEFAARESRVREREEETVGNVFRHVRGVSDGEAVVGEDFLHLAGTLGVGLRVVHKVNHALCGEAEHFGIGILHAGGAARGYHILNAGGEGGAKDTAVVIATGESGELAVKERVADAHEGDATSGIGEDF